MSHSGVDDVMMSAAK